MTERVGANGHAVVSWATIALVIGIAGTFVSGIIQIGSLQTHIQINGERITDLERRERDRITEHLGEAIAAGTVKARQEINELAIKQILDHDVVTRDREALLVERLAKVEAAASAAAAAVTIATSAANAAAAAVAVPKRP